MKRCYVSRTFDVFCVKFIAIRYVITKNFLTVQFLYIYISVGFHIAVDCAAVYALMADDVAVDGAVGNQVSVNFNFEILGFIVTVVWKSDFDRRFVWRKGA